MQVSGKNTRHKSNIYISFFVCNRAGKRISFNSEMKLNSSTSFTVIIIPKKFALNSYFNIIKMTKLKQEIKKCLFLFAKKMLSIIFNIL